MKNQDVFPAKIEQLPKILRWIRENLSELSLSASEKNKLEVVSEEIIVNIAHYAYPAAEGTIEIEIEEKNGGVVFSFLDSGKPFNPLENQKPVIKSLSVDSKDIGGLGIFFVKNLVDRVDYCFENGKNKLTFFYRLKNKKAI
jgi:serine/threonine-protein kinase RsbW